MAEGLNKAILIGNLGRDPELRYVASGTPVASFTVATSESYKDKAGVKQTRTTWHNIVIWGKVAEIANQYLKKGSQVYLEGRIENRSYDDREGNKRYISEVVVDFNGRMLMLGGRGGANQEGGADASAPARAPRDSRPAAEPAVQSGAEGSGEEPDSDLPF